MAVEQKKYGGLSAFGRFLDNLKQLFVKKTDAATDQAAGITKLYTTTGNNTDGAMTQNATTTALNSKIPFSGGELTGNLYISPYYDTTIEDPEGGQVLVVSKGQNAKGTHPSVSNEWHTMVMAVDNTGSTNNLHKYGQVETYVSTAGTVVTSIQAYKDEADSSANASISVSIDANGNASATVPAISNADDNSNKAATTAYVKANTTPITDEQILSMFAAAFPDRSY